MCSFHDSIRGTRLSELLDILYFMPYSYWRSRGIERRNFRSPSAADVLKLLEELRLRGVEVDGVGVVQLAAGLRMRLGITPRMDYHRMSSNKLAEQLTSPETITRFTAKELPFDQSVCRTADGILANIRRWSAECFGGAGRRLLPRSRPKWCRSSTLPPTRSASAVPSVNDRWITCGCLSTVIASDHAALKEALAGLFCKSARYASVLERIMGVQAYLDEIAVLADRVLVARWLDAKEELNSLTARTEALASKSAHAYGEFLELERLKDQRSDVVKSLMKVADSIQLVAPSLLGSLAARGSAAMRPPAEEHLRTLDPSTLRDRNHRYSEETKAIARQELEKLRLLIRRLAEVSRKPFTDARRSHPRSDCGLRNGLPGKHPMASKSANPDR